MAVDLFQSAALMLRYGFAAAGALIAGRALYMTIRDGGRASSIRAQARETGVIANLIVKFHGGEIKKYTLNVEGMVGAGRVCDVRIARAGLDRRHFFYEIVNGNMKITAIGHSRIRIDDTQELRETIVRPGREFIAGDAVIRFVVLRQKKAPISPMTKRAYGNTISLVLKDVKPKRVIRRRVRRRGDD
ncbi:MAG: hypothetical protein IJC48_02235 [Clostridia bacterium]|nr:hypothetical protein [Clostridia bacterium]